MASMSSGGGQNSQDFELNLASIIDCFTVLIAFMLASASFLSIGILDAGVAAAGATGISNDAPPPVNVEVLVSKDHLLTVKLSGKSTQTTKLVPQGDAYDHEGLSRTLASVKSQWPTVGAVTLTAENQVEYQDVVKTMEVARKTLPAVMLGGF